uniref:Uncharacterized protein n=1 Tax=Rhizophora mucronata TaxID=61149 RepID=A0A2P2QET4_RHIMU
MFSLYVRNDDCKLWILCYFGSVF